ncbi:MAG TPA: HPP family protein [Rubrobacter sp.]|nr:HPP family protein [Rubrobacter sp.]
MTDRITNPWGERKPFPRDGEWPARKDQYLQEGVSENVTAVRIGAGALSVALTGAILLLLGSSHPPSGATTLMVGVVLLTAVGLLLIRAAGVPVPVGAAGKS